MKYFFCFVFFSVLLSGCSSNVKLSGHNVSNLDASLNIDKSATIAVVSDPNGNQLTNKRYIPNVIDALKNRGFTNTSASPKDPDYRLAINFSHENKTETKQVPIFNHQRNIPYTVCHRNPNTDAQTCVTRYRLFMEPIISGYKTVEMPTTIYTFHYTLTDRQNKLLLDSTNTVVHESCSKWKMFEFLARDAIARANFTTPVDKPYAVEMKEGYSCQ
ncbi:hypothetical protein C0J08_19335 [Marinomonas sp. CT5]|nr:hypothetical protein C0J08_19335 [Marinomonas sp. CT5]